MGDDRPVGQLDRRQLRVSGRFAQLVTRALAEEGDRMAVGGDSLLLVDPGVIECLLHTATRMSPRATVIAVANEQRRSFGHLALLSSARKLICKAETVLSTRNTAPLDRGTRQDSSPFSSGFHDHDGYDGVFLALPGTGAHLELTAGGGHGAPAPHPESLLVLYLADDEAVQTVAARLGVDPIPPANPYWAEHGVTVQDPDGFRVVLVPERWER
jgi:hypothetical protein